MNYDQKLNPQQLEAVQHLNGPLLILAGAGSGKTRVITHRIAYMIEEYNVSPYNILAITFTNKAAKEMRERVDALVDYGAENIWVSTFHSTCVRMLRRFSEAIGYDRNFTIYDTDDQKALMRNIIKKFNIDPKKFREKFFLSHISNAKNDLITPDLYRPVGKTDPETELISKVYHEYQAQLQANNAMDFDDLLLNTVELFRRSKEALTYYRNRFRYILVDEYQDTNNAQFEFIRLLAHYETDEGDVECNLCVVGDDDQSIYGFRGANIQNILNFESNYPNAKVIKLEQNYRSTETILEAANAVIKNNRHTKTKRLWTKAGSGTPISYTVFPDEYAEARSVADEIKEQVDSGQACYNDFAILYRTNAQSRVFEAELSKRRIPNKVVGTINFYQRKEVKDVLAYLKTIDNGQDSVAVRRVLNYPKRGIGDTTIANLQAFADTNDCSFYDALTYADNIPTVKRAASKIKSFVDVITDFRMRLAGKTGSLKSLVNDLIVELDFESELRLEDPETLDDRLGNLSELINNISYYEENAEEEPTLSGFLSDVALVSDLDNVETSPDYVVMMTVHSAKGLEFEQVFLVGMEENLFPSGMSTADENEQAVEEERRLCYVAITRAKQKLFISRANRRMQHGELQCNRESRFLKELKTEARHLLTEKKLSDSGFFPERASRFDRDDTYAAGRYSSGEKNRYTSENRYTGRREERIDSYMTRGTGAQDSYRSVGGFTLDEFLTKAAASKQEPKPYDNPYRVKTVPLARTSSGSDSSVLGYTVGDRVQHVKFGDGTVTAIAKGAKDFEVTVDFPSGTKKMLASFAKLVKI